MYQFLKNLLKQVVPQNFLFRNELTLRKLLIPFYQGSAYECNICSKQWRKFIDLPGDLLCPYCGSRGRTRRLLHLLNEKNALCGNVLHFSPSRSLFRVFKNDTRFHYFSTDFENEFLADYQLDIRNIDFPNEKFDTIICYHVLEHIIEDKKAMGELFRVLKKDGACFVQTPYKQGEIYEDYSIEDEEGRLKAFGQKDHVRIYSLAGLKNRLKNAGFRVDILHFNNDKKPYGLLEETVLEIKKK